MEEHSVIGGLGSAVCDALCEKAPVRVMKIGINDRFGESGPERNWLKGMGWMRKAFTKRSKLLYKNEKQTEKEACGKAPWAFLRMGTELANFPDRNRQKLQFKYGKFFLHII